MQPDLFMFIKILQTMEKDKNILFQLIARISFQPEFSPISYFFTKASSWLTCVNLRQKKLAK